MAIPRICNSWDKGDLEGNAQARADSALGLVIANAPDQARIGQRHQGRRLGR
jgi:hypothetical protein